jgi:hypothetical protein
VSIARRLIGIGREIEEQTGKTLTIASERLEISDSAVYILRAACGVKSRRGDMVEMRVNEYYFHGGGPDWWLIYNFYCLCYEPEPPDDLVLLERCTWPDLSLRQLASIALLQPVPNA